MFTILIRKEGNGFIGTVKEVPLLGQLESENADLLVTRFKNEISFLVKGRPDLENAEVRVNFK